MNWYSTISIIYKKLKYQRVGLKAWYLAQINKICLKLFILSSVSRHLESICLIALN